MTSPWWRHPDDVILMTCLSPNDVILTLIVELRPRGAPYPSHIWKAREKKETHEPIFSWLSWLAGLLVGAYAWRRRRRRSQATCRSCPDKKCTAVCSGSMPSFLCGIFKEKTRNVLNIGLHWSNKKKIKQKARIAGKEVAKESHGPELTVLNNAVNYGDSGARERKWNKTEQCHEAKANEGFRKEARYPTITDFPKFKIRGWGCSAAVQEKSHGHVSLWLEKLQNSKQRERCGSLLDLS